MPNTHQFEHLPLVLRERGPARYSGGPRVDPATLDAKQNRTAHATALQTPASAVSLTWQTRQAQRAQAGLPTLPAGVPLLLKIDSSLDIDDLRHVFDFEVVSEQDDGFVIVASQDIVLTRFLAKLRDFTGTVKGSGAVASVHELREDPTQVERLRRVLSETLFAEWAQMPDDRRYICDVSVACTGTWQVPNRPKRGRMTDQTWARKIAEWSSKRQTAYEQWDALQWERLDLLRRFVEFYQGKMLDIVHEDNPESASLPDSFSVRLDIVAKGLKDLVLNCPFIFEVVEPDDIETPQQVARTQVQVMQQVQLVAPDSAAPAVCVIDGGIQEGHFWLQPAIDGTESRCYLPATPTDVNDHIRDGGHGTRVAGAVLHGDAVPKNGRVNLESWVQNARVLDANSVMPPELFPPTVLRHVVKQYHEGARKTRIFNHSINADGPCRTRHMSAWAAEIDRLSGEYDILIVQSAGNIGDISHLLQRGCTYPEYFSEPSCRIANPAQSFQALTVGSVAYGAFESTGWRSFATQKGEPSAFSRSGLGIWDSIKPEVVEFGGDCLGSRGTPRSISTPTIGRECYPELVRATATGGPAYDRDQVGTSFAAPKVSRIAARLQVALPDQSCLLYRGLIVQSAQWPEWAEALPADQQTLLLKRIGYGIPDIERATTNTDHRTTFITGEDRDLSPGDCHIYQVRVPDEMRRPGDDYDIRVEVTLSYVAEPRRTRRNHRGYLSVWLDWISNRRGETFEAFLTRALKDDDDAIQQGTSFGWTIERQGDNGRLRGVRRTVGTVQKDWAILKSNQLPEDFCIAVRGHRGWSQDPEAAARYCLVVSFEIIGKEIPIYEPLRVAVQQLQAEVAEVEAEVEVEVEE
jgi:hypothetical protein